MAYREIDDIQRINRLSKKLIESVGKYVLKTERRRIGFPGGHEDRDVFFVEDKGHDSLWYVNWRVANHDKQVTLLGHGEMGGSDWLPIDVQFNFPVENFHRRMGAAFLEDVETGKEFLAHRGIVTLRQRVPKRKVLEAMAADVIEVKTSRKNDRYLLAASLDSKTLVEDLGNFSRRLRRTIRTMGLEAGDPNSPVDIDAEEDEEPKDGHPLSTLQDYFEEFSGNRRAFTPKKSFPVAFHGKVVHALHEEMTKRGKTLKSQAIDLVADLREEALLFEVKTRADTQNVYCAVGQLAVHHASVARFLNKPVRKVLVVPEPPMDLLKKTVQDELGIAIVTYAVSARQKISFSGLGNL